TVGFDDLPDTVLDGELVCPKAEVDTGTTVTKSALQATTAILAADPAKAAGIQSTQNPELVFVAFDVLPYRGADVTGKPLRDRLTLMEAAVLSVAHPYVEFVPTYTRDKVVTHDRLISQGREGTVWKKLDQPYTPDTRATHWLKRKRVIEIEAMVS